MNEHPKTRPGDQELPTVTGGPGIHSLVMMDLVSRCALGVSRYGVALQAGNGRDALQDAYEEALDLACYLRQMIEERERLRSGT